MLCRSGAWRPCGWPAKEAKPIQYCSANLPEKTKCKDLVAAAKQRWIIERDYQELKQELGWGHHEGRGFHHHATLSIAAYGFLVAERAFFFVGAPGDTSAVEPAAAPGRRKTLEPL